MSQKNIYTIFQFDEKYIIIYRNYWYLHFFLEISKQWNKELVYITVPALGALSKIIYYVSA